MNVFDQRVWFIAQFSRIVRNEPLRVSVGLVVPDTPSSILWASEQESDNFDSFSCILAHEF